MSGIERRCYRAAWICRAVAFAIVLGGLSASKPVRAQAQLSSIVSDAELGSAPLAVDLVPERTLDAALQARADVPVVLAIEGLEGTTTQPVRINLFVDKPDANSRTPTDDPSWIGAVQLLPVRGAVRKVGYAFEIRDSHHLAQDQPIRITLVPVVGTDSAPKDIALRITRIYLRQQR